MGATGIRRRAGRGTVIGVFTEYRHPVAQQSLDVSQERPLLTIAERDRASGGARTAGAPDAMHVALGDVGDLVVHHERDPIDVDAAGREVGRDEHPQRPRAKSAERPIACALRFVAVNRGRRIAGVHELLSEAIRAVLGAGEHDHTRVFSFV